MEKKITKKEPKINGSSKKTQIEEIGKSALLELLFKETGYSNSDSIKHAKAATSYITSSKLILEGVDFSLTYTPLKHLGYKSALLAVGNIYAACYNPKSLSYTLGLSSRFCVEDVQELWSGVVAAAKEHNITDLTLELNASVNGLTIAVSAVGEQSNRTIKSFPAVEKTHLLCLTGNVGAAYMGLHVLERERIAFNKIPADRASEYKQPDLSKYKYILSQYLSPEVNPKTVTQFKDAKLYPSAGYFITRGLAASIKQLCTEHNLGAKIFLNKIPIAAQTFEMAEEINMDAITAALNGGDDYKFLYAIPLEVHEKFHKEFPNVDIIGHLCSPEIGMLMITPDGSGIELKSL